MPRPRTVRNIFAIAAALVLAPPALAQTDTRGSRVAGDAAWKAQSRNFDAFIKGEVPEKADPAAAADAFAQWYVFRMSWTETHNKAKELQAVASEFATHMNNASSAQNAEKNRDFVKVLSARLAAAFKDTFTMKAAGNHITLTNTALLLPHYAKLRMESASDCLAELAGGKQYHDVVRFGAVKGLREFLTSLPRREAPKGADPKAAEQAKARDARLINAVIDYVTRTWEADPDSKEELDAARFMRREGIRTLAATQLPAVEVTADGKVAGPVAHTLARVLARGKGELNPPPALSEKLEAAVGLCQMRSDIFPEYQPEAALRLVGEFLLEFGDEYIKDYTAFKDDVQRKIPLLPWKSSAVRLDQALQTLSSTLPPKVLAQSNAKVIYSDAKIMLSDYIRFHKQMDRPSALRTAVNRMKVADASLYKNAKGYEVELPGAGIE
jgi:hypothetical protein